MGRALRTAMLALLAGALLASAGAQGEEQQQPSTWTCDRLDRVPADQRCTFVREQCDSDSRIPYTEWYHCHVAPHGAFASVLFTLLLGALLPLFFTLLGDTAEIYFSPIMTHVSQSIPKMRPRFAGVTFVAIGNGAPDLSSNISAIRNGDVLLSAGALTGAAMFVQCVVASEVMRASRGPVKCRGATLRDVAIYSAAVVMVLAAFAHGRITHWFIVGAVLLYLTYAVWVFVGDEWHERGRPRAGSLWAWLRSAAGGRFGSSSEHDTRLLPWASVDLSPTASGEPGNELTAPLVASGPSPRRNSARHGSGDVPSRPTSPDALLQSPRQLAPQRHHHLVSAKAYQHMVWADLASGDERAGASGRPHGSGAEADEERGGAAGSRRHRGRGGGGGRRSGSGLGGRPVGAQGSSLELGANCGALGRSRGNLAAAAAAAAPAAAVPPATGSSQLLTLSCLDGSALPAPAPVDAVPPGHRGSGSGPANTLPNDGISHGGTPRALFGATAGPAAPALVGASSLGGASARGHDQLGSRQQDASAARLQVPWGSEEGSEGGSYSDSEEGVRGGADSGDVDSVASSRRQGSAAAAAPPPRGVWQHVRHELTVGAAAEWEELPPGNLRRRWRDLTFPLLLPVYAALRLTIPFVDPATYSRRWLIATCVGAPLLAATYLAPGSAVAAVVAACVGAALAAAVSYFTAGEEDALPDWDCGTGFAFGPAGFAVFGFFMGVIWIDTLASEVVGVISLLAGLLRVPSSVMGLTLLAWGNSLGDFFGNPAMARRGQPSMALTACFAGPLFNMLASLALGFGSYFARRRVSYAEVALRPEVALGCVFLVTYNAAVAAAGLLNGGALPQRFYLFSRAWYGLYFGAACVLGLVYGQVA